MRISSLVFSFTFIAMTAPLAGATDTALRKRAASTLGKLPAKMPENKANPSTPAKIELGKMLYFEPRLSLSQNISCNSCHNLAAGGADHQTFSIGDEGKRGGRNAPSTLNAGFQFVQFWDGRAPTLEAQAVGPITNPVEMAMPVEKDSVTVVKTLDSMPEYQAAFAKAFGGKPGEAITMANVGKTLAAFERTLVSAGRFDEWLSGKDKALTAQEKAGLLKFMNLGCSGCHTGPAIGGTMYQEFGLVNPVKGLKDTGRMALTGKEGDKFFFKVPVLRNVALNAPYFSNSSVSTLEEAVTLMADAQLGQKLSAEDTGDLVAFLKSLTGKPLHIALPQLPPSTASTPRPK